MVKTPIKKSTRSGERQHQAMSAQKRVIPGHYNPLEEVANTNNLEKSYFIKNKTYLNRVDPNAIISAMEARTRQRRLEFKIEESEQETFEKPPGKRESPCVRFL